MFTKQGINSYMKRVLIEKQILVPNGEFSFVLWKPYVDYGVQNISCAKL